MYGPCALRQINRHVIAYSGFAEAKDEPSVGRKYSERLEFQRSAEDTIRAVEVAFTECGFPPSRSNTPSTGMTEVRASRQMSAGSWGENVTAQVATAPGGGSQVVVESKLVFGFVDWGRNKTNVSQVVLALTRRLEMD